MEDLELENLVSERLTNEPTEKDPLEELVDQRLGQETTAQKVSFSEGLKRDPGKALNHEKIAKQFRVSPEFVERNETFFDAQKKKRIFETVQSENPGLASYLNNPTKAAIHQNKLPELQDLDRVASKFKFKSEEEGSSSFLGDIASAVNTNRLQTQKGFHYSKISAGLGTDEDYKAIAEYNKKIAKRLSQVPQYVKDYQRIAGKEKIEMDQAYRDFVSYWSKQWEKGILDNLSNIVDNADLGEDVLAETFDFVGSYFKNPRAAAYNAAMSSINSFAPMAVGLAALPAGSAAGGTIGALVGGPAAPVTAGAGAFLGGVTAMTTTAFGAGALLEYNAELDSRLSEKGVNTEDWQAIKEAFNDKALIEEMKSKAVKKALVTSSVDRATEFIGGKLITKNVGKATTATGKVAEGAKGFAKAQAVDVPGEALGEFAGQVAADSLEEASPSQALEEGFSSIFMGGAIASIPYAIEFTAKGTVKAADITKNLSNNAAEAIVQVKDIYDRSNEAKEFPVIVEQLAETVKASEVEDTQEVAELISHTTGQSEVLFQADEWKSHWESLGENPVQKADELLPGGRAQLAEAEAGDGHVRIPMGDYIAKFTQEDSFKELTQLIKKDIDSFTAKQASSVSANIKEVVKEVAKNAKLQRQEAVSREEARDAVKRDIEGQALAAGRSAQEAKEAGELAAALMNGLGSITGIDAVDQLNRRAIEIRKIEALNLEEDLQAAKEGRFYQFDKESGLLLNDNETPIPTTLTTVPTPKLIEIDLHEGLQPMGDDKYSPSNLENRIDLETYLKEGIETGSVTNVNTGEAFSIEESAIEDAVLQVFEDVDPEKIRRQNRTAARLIFKRNITALENIDTLLSTALPLHSLDDGANSYVGIGHTEEGIVALRFEIEDGVVRKIIPSSWEKKRRDTSPDRTSLEDQTQGEAPFEVSIDEFKNLFNFGREIRTIKQLENRVTKERKYLFQEDAQEVGSAIDKINTDYLGFYSALAEEVRRMGFKSMPPKDLANRIKKLPGIKKEELEFTGILDFLNSFPEKKISKEDTLEMLENGAIKLEEVGPREGPPEDAVDINDIYWGEPQVEEPDDFALSEETQYYLTEVLEEDDYLDEDGNVNIEEMKEDAQQRAYQALTDPDMGAFLTIEERETGYSVRGNDVSGWALYDPRGSHVDDLPNLENRTDYLIDEIVWYDTYDDDYGEGTQYEDYTLPGGDNYREIVLTARGLNYESSHFSGIDEYLAHFRVKDRDIPEGKTLFLEEIQSDLHQEGRSKGYEPIGKEREEYNRTIAELNEKIDALGRDIDLEISSRELAQEIADIEKEVVEGLREEREKLLNERNQLQREFRRKIPNAPFKNTEAWAMLVFKRALALATEGGYDSISWTPGSVQNKRYNLSTYVDNISYLYNEETDTYTLLAVGKEGLAAFNEEGILEQDLPNIVGKDVAEKIVQGQGVAVDVKWKKNDKGLWAFFDGERQISGAFKEDNEGSKSLAKMSIPSRYKKSQGFTRLEGVDLELEGEGMKGFYDKMLPKAVQKYIKKLDKDVKVGTTEVLTSETPKSLEIDPKYITAEVLRETQERLTIESNREELESNSSLIFSLGSQIERVEQGRPVDFGFKETGYRGGMEVYRTLVKRGIDPIITPKPDTIEVWNLPITDKIREAVTQGQPLFQEDGQGPRGFTDISDTEKLVIGILQSANKSTLVHELGHAFLEHIKLAVKDIQGMDTLNSKQTRFMEDINTLLQELEVDTLEDVGRDQHEKFARLLEAYLLEGKAPNKKLRSALQTFKTWLLEIYKNIEGIARAAGFDLKLTDEMREVFDRLLATEEEIKEVYADKAYSEEDLQQFADLLGIKNTDNSEELQRLLAAYSEAKDEAELTLYREHLKQVKKKATKEYKARKKDLTKQYTEEANRLPLYVAIDSIRTNKIGAVTTDTGKIPLDKLDAESREEVESLIEEQIENMIFLIDRAEPGKIGTKEIYNVNAKSDIISTFKASTSPEWYSPGMGPSKDFARIARSKKGVRYARIREAALEILENGFTSVKAGDVEDPSNEYRFLVGLPSWEEEASGATVEATPFDDVPSTYTSIKFNTAKLKEYITPKELRSFPRSLYTEEGIDPNLTAEIVGYPSGEALITEIKNNPSKQRYIEGKVQEDLNKEFPNFMDPNREQELKVEALNAVNNESQDKLKAMELELMMRDPKVRAKILKRAGARTPTPKDLKAGALAEINRTPIKDAKPYRYARAALKNRKEVMEFLSKDKEKAAEAKMSEIYNYELEKEAGKVQEEVSKGIAKLKKRFSKSDKDLAKKGKLETFKTAQAIMNRYGLLTDAQADRVDTYLKQLQTYDPLAYGKVQALVEMLSDVEEQSYDLLKVEEFRDVMTVVDALYDLGVDENKILVDGKKLDKEKVVGELTENISSISKETFKKEDTKFKKFKGVVSSIKANMARVEHLINFLDKGDFTGPFRRYLWDIANDAQVSYEQTLNEQYDKLNKILETKFKGVLDDVTDISLRQYFRGVDPELSSIKKHELIMMLLHSGNDSNKRKLVLGRNLGSIDMEGNVDFSQYDNFLNDMIKKGIIDKQVLDGVQEIWDLFEDFKPELQRAYKDEFGFFFKEVEATPIDTPFGTYAGGYFPAVTDPLLVEKEAERQNALSVEQQENQFTFAQTPQGMFKERIEAYTKALSLNFQTIRSHIEKSVRFARLQRSVSDINKILNDRTFSGILFEKNRFTNNEVLKPWLSRLATQQIERPADTTAGREFAKYLRFLRRNANMQLMFANMVNTIENLTDIPALFARMKARSFNSGLKRYIAHPLDSANFVKDNSEFMKLRMESEIFDINDTYKELAIEKNTIMNSVKNLQDHASKHAYITQRALQNVVEISAWMGAYDEGLVQFNDEKRASKYADSIIRQVMGSNRAIDLAKVETGDILQKIILTFYSYFLNKGNLALYSTEAQGGRVKAYALAMAAPAVLSAIFRRAVKGNWDEDEDDEYIDDVFDVVALSQLRFAMAVIPGGGTVSRLVEGQFTDRTYDDRLSISPLIGMVESMKGIKNLTTRDELRGRDIRDTLNFFGTMGGIPLGPVGRPLGFMIDVERGNQRAEEPIDYVRGITTGRSGRR